MDKHRGKNNKVVYATTKNADQPAYLLSMNRVLDVCMLKNIDHQLYSEKKKRNSGRTGWVRIHILFIVGGKFLVKLLVKCKTLDAV